MRRSARKPRGIALLMALAVVLLLTTFMTEYFFATGLELRAMTTFKESSRARDLARAVFRAVQIGLQLDEVEFYKGYRELSKLMEFASVPWEDGLLVTLRVEPLDHLFNLNALSNLREETDQDFVAREVFVRTLEDIEVPAEGEGLPPESLAGDTVLELYAALWDWIDGDDIDFAGFPGIPGAEATAYLTSEPEIEIKNAMLDRLSEIRLVKGVRESRIPWEDWENRFAALPKDSVEGTLYPEGKINVNVASREQIATFLERHRVEGGLEGSNEDIRAGVNAYADQAEDIARALIPEDPNERQVYTKASLNEALKSIGFDDNYGTNQLFSLVNQYYRIVLVVEVSEVQARLDAVVHVKRNDATRIGTSVDVLWRTLE